MAVYGYCRVSTDRQADEGESLGAQQRTLQGYALMHCMSVDHVFVERGVSGAKPLAERPEGGQLLATLKPGDTVVTPKLDRMFRSALDALDSLAKLKNLGVSLHMIDLGGDVTGNGISKLVFTILSAVAEAERDRIRERIRDVKADQRDRGRYLGGAVPFGWRLVDGGELVADDREQAAIDEIYQFRQEERSLRAIAESLRPAGFRLSHVGVKKIIEADVRGGGQMMELKERLVRELSSIFVELNYRLENMKIQVNGRLRLNNVGGQCFNVFVEPAQSHCTCEVYIAPTYVTQHGARLQCMKQILDVGLQAYQVGQIESVSRGARRLVIRREINPGERWAESVFELARTVLQVMRDSAY